MREKLFDLIKRKKFRKWALTPEAEARVRKAIDICVSEQRPLNFVFEFGGYKLWRLPSAPYADDAETFMLKYYLDYLRPVAEQYKIGVNMYFASDDYVVERMNNIRADAMEKYADSFCKKLKAIKSFFPENLKMSYVRLAELYSDQKELEAELSEKFNEHTERYKEWTDDKKEKMLKRAKLNFCISGPLAAKNLSSISAEDYARRLKDGAVYHDAFEDCSRRREFVLAQDKILLFCTPIPQAVAIGTTKASVTKFWTGVGIFENGLEKVLSPSQWQERANAEDSFNGK